jgi:hypothetical protein
MASEERSQQGGNSKRKLESIKVSDDPVPSDTYIVHAAIARDSSIGIAFVHQLYATMKNNSIVDEELSAMRTIHRSVKCLQCSFKHVGSSKPSTSGMGIMLTTAYVQNMADIIRTRASGINVDSLSLSEKFGVWVASNSQMSMHRRDFKNSDKTGINLSDVEIDTLIQAGYLSYRNSVEIGHYAQADLVSGSGIDADHDLFWLSHPSLR